MLSPSFQTIYEIYRPAKHTHDAILPRIAHQNIQEPFRSLRSQWVHLKGIMIINYLFSIMKI
jgi:hypothetical protein